MLRPNVSRPILSRAVAAGIAGLALLALDVAGAEARPGGGFSVGSRGFKTYTPPPSTRTAPGVTQGVQRSTTPATSAQSRPATQVAGGSRFGTGFMGGLLGAGLFGLLLGSGLFGGLGGILGFLGLIVQLGIVVWLGSLALAWFRGRSQPLTAGGPVGYQRASLNDNGPASSGLGPTVAAPGPTKPLTIDAADYAAFERLLAVIQLSFGREDQAALRSGTTPEMLSYFAEQLNDNASKGLLNEIASPKLLSGDLAEAWSEPGAEYATVAMRYELIDATVDRASGRVVSGSRTEPQQVTEVWTFTRRIGGGASAWRLSAIQQVA